MVTYWLTGLLQTAPTIPLQSVLRSSSVQADEINRVTNYFFVAAGFILLVVAALTAYVIYRFREGKQQRTTGNSPGRKWEIAMIGIPTALVAIFLYLNISTIQRVEPGTRGRQPDVVITAHQWWWEAVYPNNVIAANEIHLPAGKPLLLKLLAADVIHDWWIPQFGNKMDMIPSQENYLWLTIKKPGEYWGICSEFCGAQHAHMRLKVVAEKEDDYNRWLQAHQQTALLPPSEGAQLFQSMTCANCHRISGTTARGRAGPDLSHLGSRSTLLAGLLVNNQQNIAQWIKNPQQIKPGAHMPNFLLHDTNASKLAAYLYSLK